MMRRIITICVAVLATQMLFAQPGVLKEYRRNSLATMLVYHPEDEFGNDIYQAFEIIPTPDKYDDHNIGFRVLDNDSIFGAQKKKHGLNKAQYGHTLTPAEVKKNAECLENILNENQIGNLLVARWFGLDWEADPATWHFGVDLIQQRGQYNASDLDVEQAKLTARGVATLSDAGEELINNTFILINDITYITAEQRAETAKATLGVLGGIADALFGGHSGRDMATVAGDIADSFTGFNVKTHSYLFRLDWNDSIAAIFYNDYYTDTYDEQRINAFLSDQTSFRVRFVAHEYEFNEKNVLKGKYDRSELVKMVCTRSMDKNIASLQLAYEDFKVKTPVFDYEVGKNGIITGYMAKIGLKEGITEKSSFQVIERYTDEKTNKTKYRYVATVKPKKGAIWDNRYNAVLEGSAGSDLTATTFKKVSGGEILPGMLLVEGKYRKVEE